jgi:hypothetical protein
MIDQMHGDSIDIDIDIAQLECRRDMGEGEVRVR